MSGRYEPEGLETLTDMFILAGELIGDIDNLKLNIKELAGAMDGHVAESGVDLTSGSRYLKEFLRDLEVAARKFNKATDLIYKTFDDLHPSS